MLSFFSYTYIYDKTYLFVLKQRNLEDRHLHVIHVSTSLLLMFPSFLVSKLILFNTIIILTHSVISLGFSNAAQYVLEPLQFEVRLVNRT